MIRYIVQYLHVFLLQADCDHVITTDDAIFSRLDHHKIHEYARTAAGRRLASAGMRSPESLKRRRGRPPKYPRSEIPLVPKIEMSEQEIASEARVMGSESCIAAGFRQFRAGEMCPDEKCQFYMMDHYHCVRARCHHATDRFDVLSLHAKDFHSYITILDGFEFFERNVNCRRPHCHNNRANRHFHCVRPRCDYSFVRVSTMAQHDKKHRLAEMGLTPSPSIGILKSDILRGIPPMQLAGPRVAAPAPQALAPGLIRAAGTFFPVSGMPRPAIIPSSALVQVATTPSVMVAVPSVASTGTPVMAPLVLTPVQAIGSTTTVKLETTPTTTASKGKTSTIVSGAGGPVLANLSGIAAIGQPPVNIAPKPGGSTVVGSGGGMRLPTQIAAPVALNNALPLSSLLQNKRQKLPPQLDWPSLRKNMHFDGLKSCGRPFCKLKKKEHYHCSDCNQAFSDSGRLQLHVTKHGLRFGQMESEVKESSGQESADETNEGDDASSFNGSSSLNLNPATFSNLLKQHGNSAMDLSISKPEDDRDEDGDDNLIIDETHIADREGQSSDSNGDVTAARRSSRKRTATKHKDFVDADVAVAKMRKLSSSGGSRGSSPRLSGTKTPTQAVPAQGLIPTHPSVMMQIEAGVPSTKAQPSPSDLQPPMVPLVVPFPGNILQPPPVPKADFIPDGYQKFKFNVDCNQERCAYRLSQSHYHCLRPDCGYSLSDRSRMAQHNDRHKRLDALMGDEFQQFRGNVECDQEGCEHSRKSSHFHCRKCSFVCTDSNKVAAHRKHHAKLLNIQAQGFEKFTGSQPCSKASCSYSARQTHYHCTQPFCQQVALGPAQMNAHKIRHQTSSPSTAQ